MNRNIRGIVASILCAIILLCGCGEASNNINADAVGEVVEVTDNNNEANTDSGVIDNSDETEASPEETDDRREALGKLMAQNDEAFAWLVVPGTNIDYPVLQSWEEDDYYSSHNELKQNDSLGVPYIEMANMSNMCDFNTVIHGSGDENGIFRELANFENPDFFEENEEFFIYLEDNKLTYEIWAVFERDNNSLIRKYDFSYLSGCKDFLDDVYGDKVMGKHIRGGWGDANEYMFMVTLTVDNPLSDKQLVVIGALVDDEQGTIGRTVIE